MWYEKLISLVNFICPKAEEKKILFQKAVLKIVAIKNQRKQQQKTLHLFLVTQSYIDY